MADFPQLTEEDYFLFDRALRELLEKSEGSAAMIVEKAGHLIHQYGDTSSFSPDVMATLASNSFNAVQFMAGLLGEGNFPGMYQQGEQFSTLMLNIDEHCLLFIIFKAQLSAGAVKYFAEAATRQVAEQLQAATLRAPSVHFDLTDLNVTDASELFKKKSS